MIRIKKKIKVNAAIVGFQKCGTSALHQFLSFHPDIIVSDPKETHFFSTSKNYSKGISHYHSYFKVSFFERVKGKIFLDASPSYSSVLYQDFAISKMYSYNPSFKIICMVRNPIHRAYSAWNMYRKRFKQNQRWFQELEERMHGKSSKMIARTVEELDNFDLYVERELEAFANNMNIEAVILPQGLYSIGIRNIKMHFQNCLFIDNEDMQQNTPEYLHMVSNFLGVKKINWNDFEGMKFFNQDYKRAISSKTNSVLETYYKDSDRELEELTGISYFS
ncbi:sulfotransferase domain-containing protein [Oceanihabitans sediminis]|uniref:Sulfotransferase domain-containing protein n=1 Tax=Oceanihabitans sediminis TaxID=1812012 RepID=A0A368P3U3_9FLAO|nr:sulfotransferase domain-containing protein [Oceanihabitans sediminis]RBP26599.1 sulfotransferase domain-containing protein [Oceanihabitans sediminis]RCU57116.1 hypothetical protein DU428_09230 [Oceanihabitans sediminis]